MKTLQFITDFYVNALSSCWITVESDLSSLCHNIIKARFYLHN